MGFKFIIYVQNDIYKRKPHGHTSIKLNPIQTVELTRKNVEATQKNFIKLDHRKTEPPLKKIHGPITNTKFNPLVSGAVFFLITQDTQILGTGSDYNLSNILNIAQS